MKSIAPEEIGIKIANFAHSEQSVLFAGAGVGRRIGLPDWAGFMENLASTCDEFGDSASATLIRQRTNDSDFLGAATVYSTCNAIPVGERLKRPAAIFQTPITEDDLEKLSPLVRLPFNALITTNYDRSFHDAYAKFRGSSAIPLELKDRSLRASSSISEYFIARIHGRSELPDTMIYDSFHYEKIKTDHDYRDFVVSTLRQRPVMFLGFSFADPAISLLLDIYEERFGPTFPEMHLAVIPSSQDDDLYNRLHSVNIRTLIYDPEDYHKNLWRAVRIAFETPYSEQGELPLGPIKPSDLETSEIHRFLAFTYARTKASSSSVRPAKQLVEEGLVLSILDDDPSAFLEISTIESSIAKILKIESDKAIAVAERAIDSLFTAGEITKLKRMIQRKSPPSNELQDALESIARAVIERAKVLYSVEIPENLIDTIANIWEDLFLVRSWDLAPQYVGSVVSYSGDIESAAGNIVTKSIDNAATGTWVTRSILEVLKRPEPSEAECLSIIAKAAFVVQLTLSSTRQTLFGDDLLPTSLHLDASFLLPAIVPGHPLEAGYIAAVNRLKTANNEAGVDCELLVGEQFLEEIVSHRKAAIAIVKELHLEKPENLLGHVLLYGAENTNVFIGGYSSKIEDNKDLSLKFHEYLDDIAPYSSTTELKDFLERKFGIRTLEMVFFTENHTQYSQIFNALSLAYEQDSSSRNKDSVLVKHEAQQLTHLFTTIAEGNRSLFVTADRRLQRLILSADSLRELSGNVVSQIGFIGLIDLLVGFRADKELYTRMIWASPRSTSQQQIMDYLVSKTLLEYNEAMTMAMPEVLSEVMQSDSADLKVFDFAGRGQNAEDLVKVSKAVDRLEDDYFSRMKKVVESREKEE